MSLQRKKFSELPQDAVILSEEQALQYQLNILDNWNVFTDTFAYKYGPVILSAASFFTGLYLNTHFRQKFKLLHYGKLSTYLPVCFLPASFSAIGHMQFVLKDVVLQKPNTCPVCLEIRASSMQSMLGCVFPLVLAPIANLSIAHRYATIRLPDIATEPKKLLSFVKLKTVPILNVIFWCFVAHAVLGSAVTYFEAKSVMTVTEKLDILEKEMTNT